MAQTGYTPILIYASGTTGNTPSAANLTSSASGAELAINYFDGKLFYKDNAGVVQVLATKGTGTIGGSNTQVQYNSSGALAGSSNLTFDGTTLTANALTVTNNPTLSGGTANGVLYLNGSKVATSGSALTFDGTNLGLGGTTNSYGSQTTLTLSGTNVSRIDFRSNSTFTGSILSYQSTGEGLRLQTESSLPIVFSPNGSEQMRLTSTGLGIGTSSPGNKLTVKPSATSSGTFDVLIGSTNTDSIRLSGGGTVNTWLELRGFLGVKLYSDSTNTVTVDSSGNLGIGTTSPLTRLDVKFASNKHALLTASAGYSNGADLIATDDAGSEIALGLGGNTVRLYTGATERARITSGGDLLVGTTSAQTFVSATETTLTIKGNAANKAAALSLVNASGDCYGGIGVGEVVDSLYLGATTNHPVVFLTNNTERARIDSSGRFAVGGNPDTNCMITAVATASRTGVFGAANTAGFSGVTGANSSNTSTGYAGYFSNSGSGTGLYISNTAAWQSTSDERLKTDIKNLNTTERLMQIQARDYLWKSQATSDNQTRRNFGFIAQEVQEVFPELVGEAPDGMLSVEYTGFIAPLVKAIQEQQALITDLRARVAALEAQP